MDDDSLFIASDWITACSDDDDDVAVVSDCVVMFGIGLQALIAEGRA